MAGQAPRGSRGHGRSSRHGLSPSLAEAASAAGPGLEPAKVPKATDPPPKATDPPPKPTAVDPTTPAPTTQSTYRMLQLRGLTAAEAASLTAFMFGLPTTDLRWSLKQLNQLLFLRRLRQTGAFDGRDGRPARPH